MKTIEIDLTHWDIPGIGGAILVRRETGVTFTAQAGGTACCHPSAEGFIIPLPCRSELSEQPEVRQLLNRYGLTRENAESVAKMCRRLKIPFAPSTDSVSLEDGREAWVLGRIHVPPEGSYLPRECHGMEAVLLWDNSD